MQAVLAATAGDRKLYYFIDAKPGEDDGALVTSYGKVMNLNFFSFVNKTSGLKKIMSTPFHKFLWTPPADDIKKLWISIFIDKEKSLDERFINNLSVQTSLDRKPIPSA